MAAKALGLDTNRRKHGPQSGQRVDQSVVSCDGY